MELDDEDGAEADFFDFEAESEPVMQTAIKTEPVAPSTGLPTGTQWQNFETVFTNAKAGMAGVDKEHVKKVVYEMSKDSPHFKNEQRKQKQSEGRTRKMLERAKQLSPAELDGFTRLMDKKIASLKACIDLTRTWIHVDMDAFYAAVEELHDPSLKDKPMAVGGIGMVCTANYEARKYGVRAAMPGFIARRLCPQLLFARPDFQKYTKVAKATRLVFQDYDPDFSCGSLDEAYMDVTAYCQTHGMTGAEVAQAIRRRVHAATQLTCSCGVAPNRLLAKICSDINKPNGQAVLQPDPAVIKKFVDDLPVRKVPMIGKVTEQMLRALGVTRCADLVACRGLLGALYSSIATDHFMAVGLGIGATLHSQAPQEGEAGRKGMSVERTFRAISSKADLEAKCAELAEKLAADLVEEGLKGRTLTLKLKATNFEVRTRAATLPQFISASEAINSAALRLLRPELPIEIRLMGLRMSNFLEVHLEPGQRSMSAFLHAQPGQAEPAEHAAAPAADDLCGGCGTAGEAEAGEQAQSQSHGQEHELSLRDWAPRQAASQGSQPVELSLRDWGEADQLGEPPGGAGASHSHVHSEQVHTDREQSPGGSPASASPQGKPRSRTWECKLCTYAGNPQQWLRCEVCDSLRGSTLPPLAQAEMAEGAQRSDTVSGRQQTSTLVMAPCRTGPQDVAKVTARNVADGPKHAPQQSCCLRCGKLIGVHEQSVHGSLHAACDMPQGPHDGISMQGVKGTGPSRTKRSKPPLTAPQAKLAGVRTLESFMKRTKHAQ